MEGIVPNEAEPLPLVKGGKRLEGTETARPAARQCGIPKRADGLAMTELIRGDPL